MDPDPVLPLIIQRLEAITMDPDPVLPLIIQRLEEIGGSGSVLHQEEDQPPNEQAMEGSSANCGDQTGENKEDETREEEVEEDDKEENYDGAIKDFSFYLPLYKNVVRGDWEKTKQVFDHDPEAKTAGITFERSTALHVAVSRTVRIQFVRNLVASMSKEDVATIDNDKMTVLHCAAVVGYTEAAKILVEKNPSLTQVRDPRNNLTPLHSAASYAQKSTARYLLSVTRDEYPSPFTGESGATLLNFLVQADFYDLAIHLLRRYPSLALERDKGGLTALDTLALKPRAFLSGSQLGYFQRLLYKCTSFKKAKARQREDIENPASNIGCHLEEPRKIGYLQHIHKAMLMHQQVLELTKLLFASLEDMKLETNFFLTPILTAAQMGIREIVLEIIKMDPDALRFRRNDDRRNVFHWAVLYRKEQVYNLVYQMSSVKHFMIYLEDNLGNNLLHLAGKLEPSNRISGAALQMQRELQWFKEVEKIFEPSFKERKNNAGKTARDVFTEEHKELVVKGEKWMKATASSCTVVAALVVTVVFAAAFTLPGGNTSDGTPVYLHDLSFLIFTVSNALGLFASSTSVLMFLGILTSRYSEEDFLRALPMRLCIGLITLFLSIAFMLVAFSCSLHIVLVRRLKWVAAPIILLAGIPVTLFGFLQFPLLVEIVSSTFGPSIFRPQGKEIIY